MHGLVVIEGMNLSGHLSNIDEISYVHHNVLHDFRFKLRYMRVL